MADASNPARQLRVGPATIDFPTLADTAHAIADGSLTGAIHLCNAYTLALADERDDVASSLRGGVTNVPDGTPLVWWARRQGISEAERVYGPDLMEAVIDTGRAHSTTHYLYGSTEEVLAALESAIERRWPGARVVGAESPPFRELSDDELKASVERAREAGAGVVWVGMGTPKQDLIAEQMATMSDQAFVAIGAAFEFIAGTKRQAPRWMMRLGLEWLYRLTTEPRRLWRRYVIYNAKFLRLLWRSRA